MASNDVHVTPERLDRWLECALEICDEADAMALRAFRTAVLVSVKQDGSLVTEVDQAIEGRIRELLAQAFPSHTIVGEEFGISPGREDFRWYVDPIDGTNDFIRGVPLFGTLLALEVSGELQVGVMSAPALGTRWFARRGGGAWVVRSTGESTGTPERISVSAIDRWDEAQIFFASFKEMTDPGTAPGFPGLVSDAWRDRGFGEFWSYALVAEGAGEAVVSVGPKSWDLAAPMVIVEEAGGRMTDLEGRRSIHTGSTVVTNGRVHQMVLARLSH